MKKRVVHWGTGQIGKLALERVITHPDLELVGLVVSDSGKAGRDAAELCGLAAPTGILATTDVDAALQLSPDAVCYTSVGTGAREKDRSEAALADMANVLSRGISLVSPSVTPLVYPPSAPEPWRRMIEDACREGQSSCFVTGTHPGFLTDLLPLTMTGLTGRIDQLTIWEIISYEKWTKPEKLKSHFGIGMPADYAPPIFNKGTSMHIYGAVLAMLADLLNVSIDRFEERNESWFTPEPLPSCAGMLPVGARGAIRFGLYGIAEDRDVIVLDHIYRAHPDAAPQWRQPPGTGGYALEIKGDPDWSVDFAFTGRDGDALAAGLAVTAVRVVNSIKAVCEAAPGLLVPLDLPLISGRGLFYPPPERDRAG